MLSSDILQTSTTPNEQTLEYFKLVIDSCESFDHLRAVAEWVKRLNFNNIFTVYEIDRMLIEKEQKLFDKFLENTSENRCLQ